MVAQVRNLSVRGVFVTGPEIPQAGTEVLCRLLLDGQPRTLKGRVVWMRPTEDRGQRVPGAGIEFLELSRDDADKLNALVAAPPANDLSDRASGPTDAQTVDVWFEGMPTPIRSKGAVTVDGLRISTRLPFLRLNSTVKVSFSRDGVEEVRTGTLATVTLEPSTADGIPQLALVVTTPLPNEVHGTIDVASPVGAAPSFELPNGDPRTVIEVNPMTAAPPVATVRTIEDDRTQRIFLGVPELSTVRRSPPPEDRTPPSVSATGSGPTLAAFAKPRWWPRLLVLAGLSLAAAGVALVMRRPPIVVQPQPSPRAAVAAPAPVEPPPQPAAPRPAPIIVPVEPEPAPADPNSVVISIVGSTKGVDSFPLREPPGTAVKLPRARPRTPDELRDAPGPFRKIHVQRRGAGTQLRFFHAPNQTADVEVDPGGIRVTLRPKRKR